jgi:hypothetical protein
MTTINEIIEELKPRKAVSRMQVRRYMQRLKIKPLGCRQNPNRYPPDTSARIIRLLGLDLTNGHAHTADDGKIVGLKKLQGVRAGARRGK